MAHITIGELLDQSGIQGFDDFRHRTPRDKDAFVRHLYSIAWHNATHSLAWYNDEAESNERLSQIEAEFGLKMCFQVTKDSQGWHNIPNDTFAKKLALYTTRTVITFPFHQFDPSSTLAPCGSGLSY